MSGEAGGSGGEGITVGKSVRTISGLTLVSRVLGLARDVVTARIFGDTALGSSFAAALAIPNAFRRLFGEGAISAAFVPPYTRLLRDDGRAAGALASMTVGAVAVVTGLICVLGEAGLAAIVGSLTPGDPSGRSLRMIMVTLPFMPLICVAAILGAMLQARGRFGPWAAAPIILNLCMLVVATPFFFVEGADAARWAFYIGAAVVTSGAIQVVWSLIALGRGGGWTRSFGPAAIEGKAMLGRLVPALIGLGTLQLSTLLDTAIAMWPNWVGPTFMGRDYPLDTAANSVLFYAQRLYQFPLGVFGIAVATAVFPALSRASEDPSAFSATLREGLRLSLFIGLPASVGLALVGGDLSAVIFGGQGPGFSDAGVARVGAVLVGYATAVWAYSLNQVVTRAFYALGDTSTPMRVAMLSVAVNLTLNLVLIWTTPLREAGLAWATAASAMFQCVALIWLLGRRMRSEPLRDPVTLRSCFRTVSLSALMACGVIGVRFLPIGDGGWPIWRLLAQVTVGVGIVGVGAWIVRAPELRALLGRSVDSGRG